MNYQKHHDLLISTRGNKQKPRDGKYYERHHILPKSLGGTKDEDNLIYLTGREHFVIHWLLCKIHNNEESLSRAFKAMGSTSRSFEAAREAKGKNLSLKYARKDLEYKTTEDFIKSSMKNLGNNTKNEEYKKSVSGVGSPVSKFIWDFYKEDNIVHTGTYSTFAKEFQHPYGGVYSGFKNKGFYKEYTYGNKRENPDRTKSRSVNVIDYVTGKILERNVKISSWGDEHIEKYGVPRIRVYGILNYQEGKSHKIRNHSKGITFEYCD